MSDIPHDPQRGVHNISLGPVLYIERSDFMEAGQKGYRRLTPQQPVGLKHASRIISLQDVIKVTRKGGVVNLRPTCRCNRRPTYVLYSDYTMYSHCICIWPAVTCHVHVHVSMLTSYMYMCMHTN